jgi:phage terminase small subunit
MVMWGACVSYQIERYKTGIGLRRECGLPPFRKILRDKMHEIPKHLKKETQGWIKAILADYEMESHHVKLLFQAAECWERIGQARETIKKDGAYFTDRWGQPRKHPALDDERNNRVVFARLLRELNLSDEAPESRPPSLKYRR